MICATIFKGKIKGRAYFISAAVEEAGDGKDTGPPKRGKKRKRGVLDDTTAEEKEERDATHGKWSTRSLKTMIKI